MPKGIYGKTQAWKIDVAGEEFQVKFSRRREVPERLYIDYAGHEIVVHDNGSAMGLAKRIILAVNAISLSQRLDRRRGLRRARIVWMVPTKLRGEVGRG